MKTYFRSLPSSARRGNVFLFLLPIIVVLGAIGAYWFFRYIQTAKLRMTYAKSEVELGFNILGYIRQTGHFPHDIGGLSWRVELLRGDGDESDAALFQKFHLDELWDGPHNKLLIEQAPWWLQDPEGKKGQTCYRGVRGKDCAFDDDKEVKPPANGWPVAAVVMTKESCPWTKPADVPVADVEKGDCLRWFKIEGLHIRADADEDGYTVVITNRGTPDLAWFKSRPSKRPPLRLTDTAGQH